MELDYLGILLRWMHIFAAIALFGGAIFQRFALLPAVGEVVSEPAALQDAVRRRWSKVVMIAVLFLLVSGLTNYILTARQFKPPHPELPKLYHALFGVKFLLAMVIFFFASALAGRGSATQRFRDNARTWLTVTLVLATILVGISGVMRSTHTGPKWEASAPAASDAAKAGPPPSDS